jgi:O-antigen ligase
MNRDTASSRISTSSLAKLVSLLLFLGPALSMVVTSIYPSLGLILTAIGLYSLYWNASDLTQARAASLRRPFLAIWALIAFGIVMLLENIIHRERWGAYHIVIAIFVLWPAYFACAIPGVRPRALWAGAAVGAMTAVLLAIFQVFFLGHERASGLTNPIPFGNVSLVLATGSLIGLLRPEARSLHWAEMWLYVAGGFAGIGASLLSGTKSGWLSLLIVAFVGYGLFPARTLRWKKWLAGLGVAATLGLIITLPQIPVMSRLVSMWEGVQSWVTTGDITEGSIGPRLEMWKFGLDVAAEKPILGFGKDGMMERKRQAIETENYSPGIAPFATLHNEFLNMWVTKGLVGTLALLVVFGSVFFSFFRTRKSPNWQLRCISLMGTSLTLMFLEFGIGEIALLLNSYRHVFLFWVFALAGLSFRMTQEDLCSSQSGRQ